MKRRPASSSPPAPNAGRLIDDLRQRIMNCELLPGERLRFDPLRTRYAASMGTLREALTLLQSERLVEGDKGRGFRVAPVAVADLLDITELRVELELRALRLSIAHGTDQWEADLVSAWHLLSKSEASRANAQVLDAEWARRHTAFHDALVAACPSALTLRFRAQLFSLAQRYIRLSLRHRAGRPSRGFGEHEELMKAAIARDEKTACEVLEKHIRATTATVLKAVPELRTSLGDSPSPARAVESERAAARR